MSRKKKCIKLLISLLLLIIFVNLFLFAPNYLTYTDKLPRSEVIVVLAGTDLETKIKEALRLINRGYATIMMVPSCKQIVHLTGDGELDLETTTDLIRQTQAVHSDSSDQNMCVKTCWIYERTHVEILVTKETMEQGGFSSAIFLSFPYHTRRVKIIANRVFDGTDCRLHFVYIDTKEFSKTVWWLRKADIKWVLSKYIKIAWFLLYTHILNFSPA